MHLCLRDIRCTSPSSVGADCETGRTARAESLPSFLPRSIVINHRKLCALALTISRCRLERAIRWMHGMIYSDGGRYICQAFSPGEGGIGEIDTAIKFCRPHRRYCYIVTSYERWLLLVADFVARRAIFLEKNGGICNVNS